MNKQRASTLGSVSGLLILSGCGMGVIIYFIVKTILEGVIEDEGDMWTNLERSPAPGWMTGLIFVVPGVIGLIAALVQNKCLYIVNCIISLLSLIIVALLFFFIGMALIIFIFAMSAAKENCIDNLGVCTCRTGEGYDNYEETAFKTCDFLTTMTGLCIGLFVITVLAWILMLVMFVLSCVYACRSEINSGTVFVPAQQPMLPPEQQYPPQYQK